MNGEVRQEKEKKEVEQEWTDEGEEEENVTEQADEGEENVAEYPDKEGADVEGQFDVQKEEDEGGQI